MPLDFKSLMIHNDSLNISEILTREFVENLHPNSIEFCIIYSHFTVENENFRYFVKDWIE